MTTATDFGYWASIRFGLPRAVSAYIMTRVLVWRRYLSANTAKRELRALDERGLADIGIASYELDEVPIDAASAETRDYVVRTAGWPYR
jgi:uncharacterized protein YjiS (DUF1127 family)